MSRLVLSVVCLALGILFIRADPAFAERRVALVIGNSDYQYAPALPNPRRDAQAMAAMFQKAGLTSSVHKPTLEFCSSSGPSRSSKMKRVVPTLRWCFTPVTGSRSKASII